MSSGKEHAVATRRNGLITSAVGFGSLLSLGLPTLGLVAGAWFGHWITPDFDLSEEHPIFVQRKIIQKHKILGWCLWAYWYPYAKLIPHRGSSHSWPIGTIVRMIYTLAIPAYLLVHTFPQWFPPETVQQWYAFIFFLFVGWSVQDITHLRMDGKFRIFKFKKRPRRNRFKTHFR